MKRKLLEYNRKDLRNWAGEELAAQFFDNRSKYPAPYNNLDHWISKSTPQELADYMNSYKSKNQQKKEVMMDGAEKIYDDGRWTVIHVTKYEAMTHYGKGTRWCIAGNYPGYIGRGQGFFNDYAGPNGRYTGYYVFIDKQGAKDYNKWCVCPYKNDPTTCDIWNAPDDTVSCIPGAPNVPGLPSVSSLVIEGDTLVKVKDDRNASESTLVVPGEIKKIARKACFGVSVEKIVLPEGLEEIGSGAFATSRIKGAVIPNSVKSIGNALWLNCDRLRSINLPESITTLTKNLCSYCDSLSEISIHGSISEINDEWCNQGRGKKVTVYFDETKNEKLLNWLKARSSSFEGISILSAEVLTD